jgi:hypothetical protein
MKRPRPLFLAGPEVLDPLDWKSPVAARRWLQAVRGKLHRIVALAEDAQHPDTLRILPRRMARAELEEHARGLRFLLRAATLGLPKRGEP